MKYVLPLTPDYVSDWSDWHAVRELLQNAMDAHDAGGEKPTMTYEDGTLVVESPRERLPRRSLLLGGTTKAKEPGQRGKFGEGYKLALLVFCRKLYHTTVINGGELWRPNFEASKEFDGESVLTIEITSVPQHEFYDGVRFIVKDFPSEAWEIIKERWLPDVPHDTILPKEQRGNIYSGGLFITKSTSLLRGYNYAPHRLPLGRDRDVTSDWDAQYHAAKLWENCGSERVDELMSLLKVQAADVEYVSYVPAADAQVIVKAYEKEYGEGTVPVKDQKELDAVRSSGFNGQIDCDQLRRIVNGIKKFVFHEVRTPGGRLKAFFDKIKDRLDLDIREELEILVRESQGWR